MDNRVSLLKKNTDSNEKPAKEKQPEERKIKVSVSTSVGCVRERNEDNFYADEFGMRLEEEDVFTGELDMTCRRIFAVCDGMGGEDFGDEASEISSPSPSEKISFRFRYQAYHSSSQASRIYPLMVRTLSLLSYSKPGAILVSST